MLNKGEDNQRLWKSQADFFDNEAELRRHEVGVTDPLALRRYGNPHARRRFARELRFRVVRPLEGKSVLDVGCGEGSDTVLLAQLGAARVVGLDCSAKALELTRLRAEANGVSDRVELVCAPVETADLPPRSFDIIWCNAILHHLTHALDLVMRQMALWAKPDGMLSFAEPTSLSPTLRWIRKLVPVSAGEVTEGERPLEPPDLEIVHRYVPDLCMRHFRLLGRVDELILRRIPPGSTLPQFNYERAPLPKRALVNAIASLDWVLLSLPGIDHLGSTSVMWGHPRGGTSW